MAKDDIDKIKAAAGDYSKDALEGRRQFLNLRLRQDAEVRKIFTAAGDRVAAELKRDGLTLAKKEQLAELLARLDSQTGIIRDELTEKLKGYIESGVEAGSYLNRAVMVRLAGEAKLPEITSAGIQQMFVRVNTRAVNAVWNHTSGNGFKLSDRIWNTSQRAMGQIKNIIQQAGAIGQDPYTTARMVQGYIKKGAMTFSKDYPYMAERLKGIPKDVSYEALRLVRTETTRAVGKGTIEAAQASPSCEGIQYCLSTAHRIVDICDELAKADEAGLGMGVYPVNDPPVYPAHPNTMSYLVAKHAKPEDFVKRLKAWKDDPESQPDLENWYQNDYLNPEQKKAPSKTPDVEKLKKAATSAKKAKLSQMPSIISTPAATQQPQKLNGNDVMVLQFKKMSTMMEVGTQVTTPKGIGKIAGFSPSKKLMEIELENGDIIKASRSFSKGFGVNVYRYDDKIIKLPQMPTLTDEERRTGIITTISPLTKKPASTSTYKEIKPEEKDDFISKMTKDWNVSKEEKKAFRGYIGKDEDAWDYGDINNLLRMGEEQFTDFYKLRYTAENIKDIKNTISIMSKALKRCEIPDNIIVFRGCNKSALFGFGKRIVLSKEIMDQLVGSIITDNGFMSTTLLKNSSTVKNVGTDVFFEINVPKGTKGQYISSLAGFEKENEILLDKETKLRIKSYQFFKTDFSDHSVKIIAEVVN